MSTISEKLITVAENIPKVYEAGERSADEVITRTITEYSNDRVTTIGSYAFYNCTLLTTITFPVVTSIGESTFYSCTSLSTITFPAVTSIGVYAFYDCSSLTTADFPLVTSIGSYAFYKCTSLETVILRNNSVCSLNNTNAFKGCTHITGTGGYIYVPSSLIDTYKTATNWVTYASKFRALEDYTVDGTTTGALDESKVIV